MEVVVRELLAAFGLRQHRTWLCCLFEILAIVAKISLPKRPEVACALVLPLPEQILAQGLCEFGGEHVASRGARRQRQLVVRIGCSHDDWSGRRTLLCCAKARS